MNIKIDDEQLRNLLESKKNHIGFSWIPAIMNIGSGIALLFSVPNVDSDLFPKFWYYFFILFAIVLVILGIYQFVLSIGKYKYDYKILYNDILTLNKDRHYYSLVAIKNTFDEFPNKFLLYYDEKWTVDFFPAFQTLEKNDIENIRKRLSENLKIDVTKIDVSFLIEITNQKKFSEDGKIEKVYDHRYYQAVISEFPEKMKNNDFTIEGRHYKWLTFLEMKAVEDIVKKNKDVIEIFEKYCS